jgi:uncharacterized SAM-binding protein YcdF (DUF218 family)
MTLFSRTTIYLFWLPLTLLLATSTLDTKTTGLAWLWLILAGLLAWWQAGYGQNLLEPLRRTHLNANYFAWVCSGLAVACALAVTLPN